MMTIVLSFALPALLIGLFIGWFPTKKKASRQLDAEGRRNASLEEQLVKVHAQLVQVQDEKATLNNRLFQSAQKEKELSEALTHLTQEKIVFSTDLEAAWKLHTALKAKYDALYLKNIEVTNEKNRLKRQVPPGQEG